VILDPMSEGPWTFNGSRVIDGTFIAQRDGAGGEPAALNAARLLELRQTHPDPVCLPHQKFAPPPETRWAFAPQTSKAVGDFEKDRPGLDVRSPVHHEQGHFCEWAGGAKAGRPGRGIGPNVYPDRPVCALGQRQGERDLAGVAGIGMPVQNEIGHGRSTSEGNRQNGE
jgi:hypothetical protein